MLRLLIECEGKALGDIIDALEEAKRLIEEGNIHGFNSNDDGNFTFTLS